jgi:hypothetical protein
VGEFVRQGRGHIGTVAAGTNLDCARGAAVQNPVLRFDQMTPQFSYGSFLAATATVARVP